MAYTRTDGPETHREDPRAPSGRTRWRAPRPLVVLGWFLGAIAVISTVLAAAGVTYTGAGGRTESLQGLLSASGLAHLLVTAVTNFTSFPALGVVLTLTLGLGIAQGTGALEAAVRLAFLRVPARVVPYGVAFLACQGHVMSDAAFIVMPRLAMEVYRVKGRNPLAGLIAGLACTTVGYGGGLLFGTADVGYTGVTEAAARLLPHTRTGVIGTTMNWYFSAAAGIVVPIVCGWIIVHVLEPRLPASRAQTGDTPTDPELTGRQRGAVYVAYAAVGAFVAVMVTWWLWPGSPLRGEGGALVQSPFRAGVDLIAMPCNTAHAFLDAVRAEAAPVPVLDMVTETAAEVRALLPEARVGVLATSGTLSAGLHQNALARHALEPVIPDHTAQEAVMAAIRDVKAGDPVTARTRITSAIEALADRGADVAVAACTEIPLLFAVRDAGAFRVVDATDVLARAVVRHARRG